MSHLRSVALGLALLVGAAPAFAQQGPRLVGGGDNAQVVYDGAGPANVIGGGRTVLRNGTTGGIAATYLDTMPAGSGGVATLSGGGDDGTLTYGPGADTSRVLASRR